VFLDGSGCEDQVRKKEREMTCSVFFPCHQAYLLAPLALSNQNNRSNKVDVWSIGVIYFQMLYGRRPFGDGQSQDHILRNQTMLHATEVHFPSKPCISEEGKAFIRDCLTYDQMSRPNVNQICEHDYMKLSSL